VNKIKVGKNRLKIVISVVIILILLIGIVLYLVFKELNLKYNLAVNSFNAEEFSDKSRDEIQKTIALLSATNGYKNSNELLIESKYELAVRDLEMGLSGEIIDEAINLFSELGDYKDSNNLKKEALYAKAMNLYESGDFDNSIQILNSILDYKDCNNILGNIDILKQYQGNWYSESGDIKKFSGNQFDNYKYDIITNDLFTCKNKNMSHIIKIVNGNIEYSFTINNIIQYIEIYTREYNVNNDNLASYPKEPTIGMTQDEVLNSSWGKPLDRNKTTTEYGVSEQWVYGSDRYIYFDNGIVTAIQN
jgi:tetratricopeptide (TPR) repeat protein